MACTTAGAALAQTIARFDMAPTRLPVALRRVAEATGGQIVFDSQALQGRRAPALRGQYSLTQAVDVLLAGSGLGYRIGQTGVLIVGPVARPSSQAAPPETVQVEDVIVTARKREERLIDVPIAITAITGAAIEGRGALSVADLLQEAPGVGVYDLGSGRGALTIRGISTSLGFNENGYYLDDLPFTGVTVPIVPDVRAWDLDRVEVLRGPQGTLFGEGSMGGTIRILTADADLNAWEVKANATRSKTVGGGANVGIKAAVNLPIIPDVLALRVAATHESFEGWIDDAAAGRSDVNAQTFDTVRTKILFKPSDRLSLRASYWTSEGDFPNGGSTSTDNGQVSKSFTVSNTLDYRLLGASARYELDRSNLFYSYSNKRFSLPQMASLYGGDLLAGTDISVVAHELRWSSTGPGAVQWTIGAYRREAKRDDRIQFALFGVDTRGSTDTTAEAVFGEGTYRLPNAPIDITLGLRYFRDDLLNQESNSGVAEAPVGGDYDSLNPRIIVSWRPRQDMNIYASATKGFRSGQTQPRSSVALAQPLGIELPTTIGQDWIWTYELGTKALFLDRSLAIEAAVYYSRWQDVAVRIPIADTSFNGLINSEGTETKGLELSVAARPFPGLTLLASGSYIDAQYIADVPGTGIVAGAAVEGVARYTAKASADYRWSIQGDRTGFARLAWEHTSPRSFASFPQYLPGDTIDRVDARLGMEFNQVTVALYVDNLTDENGATTYRTVTAITPDELDITSPRLRPRTLGLEASFRFGAPR